MERGASITLLTANVQEVQKVLPVPLMHGSVASTLLCACMHAIHSGTPPVYDIAGFCIYDQQVRHRTGAPAPPRPHSGRC